jgi:hypothetical protein
MILLKDGSPMYDQNPRKVVTKHPTCVETGECRAPRRGGKNTRQWCKGRVGTPHTWEWARHRDELAREQFLHLTYNRITERPVCFACSKEDVRYRHYCRQCGEPWPALRHGRATLGRRWADYLPCVRCGAPWLVRHRSGAQWKAAGAAT